MTANSLVNLLSFLWIALTVIVLLLGIGAFQIDSELAMGMFAASGILWSISIILAIVVMGLRLFLQQRLSGMSIWLGWVPPIGASVSITGLAIFGHIVG